MHSGKDKDAKVPKWPGCVHYLQLKGSLACVASAGCTSGEMIPEMVSVED